ncbi:MAG: hypothetical protein H7287_08235 [Thermoleophilia bacterium]|nr:hypothetical protein [Thermoleophilia bacterium]
MTVGAVPQSMNYQLPPQGQMPLQSQAQFQPVQVSPASQLPQGAIPLTQDQVAQLMNSSQGPAIQQATLAANAVQAPVSSGRTLLTSILAGAGIGAAVGGGVGLIPVLPPSPLVGALIGAGAGALIGGVVGFIRAKRDRQQASMLAATAQNTVMTAPVGEPPAGAAAGKIHLNDATKAKLKLKNDAIKAERAAAASAAAKPKVATKH